MNSRRNGKRRDVTFRVLTNPLTEYTTLPPRPNANPHALVPIGRPSRHRLARLSPFVSEGRLTRTTYLMPHMLFTLRQAQGSTPTAFASSLAVVAYDDIRSVVRWSRQISVGLKRARRWREGLPGLESGTPLSLTPLP